jgi:hypothetical protein
VKKVAQNVAKPIFATSLFFKKKTKVDNHPVTRVALFDKKWTFFSA